jgi:FtsP/CotA-like multicopper oxidase with cupredoxin domain
MQTVKRARIILLVCALVAISGTLTAEKPGLPGPKVRLYYIAADQIEWEYAPNALPLILGGENELQHVPRINLKTYVKAVYREYTDATFQAPRPRPAEWEHLGLLGPLIRAQVGDTIKVVFKNNTHLVLSMHPHGLSYGKDSEGAYYVQAGNQANQENGAAVRPGQSFTYTWTVPESAGPGPHDPSSILWMYHSHFVETRDINSGLVGPILVTRRGQAKADLAPVDVDREFVVAFAVFDESQSAYFMENVVRRAQINTPVMRDPSFSKALLFYTMNGYTHGTMPLLTMKKGERVRWYLFASANEDDVHSPHWHGATVISNMMRTDTLSLTPMAMAVADMIPENVGTWLFHCHVNDHLDNGMLARYSITP